MTKTIALAGAAAALIALCFCARQAPKNEEKTLEGTLEDLNGTVAVVRDKSGREHMFWLTPGTRTEVRKGDPVVLHYSTGKDTGRKVKNLIDIRKN